MRQLNMIICGLALIACGGNTTPPPAPTVDTPSTSVTINGSERIGWDQSAADAVELATFGYAIYVDGVRMEVAGVTCASAPTTAFPCSGRMPSMSPGSHTLELASFVNAGSTVLESARSAALHVTLVAQTVSTEGARALGEGAAADPHVIVDGLNAPTDIAFAPDGRLFVAERGGQVRIVRNGRLLAEPAISLTDAMGRQGQLLAIALDPQFERTHDVFVIFTAPDRSGVQAFTLARFREVSDTLGDRAILLDSAPASAASPSAALRFGPDGKLYAAYDDGGDARGAQNPSSLNGKVLRLNVDGTTPSDARGGTPIYAGTYGSPIAIDWDPPTATLWVADRSVGSTPFAFYRGALFPDWSGRILSASTLLDTRLASQASRIAVGPDGAIYYLTARAIGRLVPDRTP